MAPKKRRPPARRRKSALRLSEKRDPGAIHPPPKRKAEAEPVSALYAQLSGLHSITKTVSASLNVEEIFYEAVNLIKDVLGVQAAAIFAVDWSRDMLILKAERSIMKHFVPIITGRTLGETLSGRAVQLGEQIYVENITSDPRVEGTPLEDFQKQEGPASIVATPLKARNKICGVLTVRDNRPNRFTAQELLLLNSVADELAVAIENASLFEEVKSKSEELAALVRINRNIAALLDRETLLSRIAEEARGLLQVDSTTFRVIEGNYLVRRAQAGEKGLIGFREKIGVGESITGKAIREKRAIALHNLQDDHTIIPEHREISRKAGYHSLLSVPVATGDRILGGLNLYSKEKREFTSNEIGLITAFADQAAIALENARLFAELQEASQAKSEFMSAMSHELRTPLNVIIGNADLLRDGYFGEVSETQKGSLEKVLHYSKVLLDLITNVLNLSRLEAKKMSLHVSCFHLGEILDRTRILAEQLARTKPLEVLWEVERNLPAITTDALKLEEILQNLIENAFKFTPTGRIEVRARDLKEKGQIEFTVADTGIGIEEKDLDRIFEEFYQLKEAHTRSYLGVGLGLSIVKKYLELMQGEIRVESQLGSGSTFAFTLPYFLQS